MKKTVTIKQDEENPIVAEVLAAAIRDMGEAVKKFRRAGIKRRALELLIADRAHVGMGVVGTVLDSIEDLERAWLTAK